MKHKLKDAINCTKSAKTELNKSKLNLTKVVRKGTFVRKEFMGIVDKELNHIWKQAKEKKHEKTNWNIKRHKLKEASNEGTFNGILVGDSELEKYEKELAATKQWFMQE